MAKTARTPTPEITAATSAEISRLIAEFESKRRVITEEMAVLPRRTGATAYWVAEGSPFTESSVSFDAMEASPHKQGILVKSSSELFDDAAADVGRYLAEEFASALALSEDDCGWSGDGTSAYGRTIGLTAKIAGMKSAVAMGTGHNTWATIDAADIGALVGGVMGSAVTAGSAFYIHPLGFGPVFARLAGSGHLIVQQKPNGTLQPFFTPLG